MTFEGELDAALRAARAGMAAMGGSADYRGAETTASKENVNDLVTAADRASQRAILDELEAAFPADSVVAEEDETAAFTGEGREWVVDPIDGTANFAVGFPYYCVSIALVVDGQSTVGVVASPPAALDCCWYAVRGEGAFVHDGVPDLTGSDDLDGIDTLGGRRLSVTDQATLAGSVLFARLSERDAGRRRIDRQIVEAVMDQEAKFRRTASAALNLCQVAEGHADGYVVLSLQQWDVAAGTLLVEEAGGTVRQRPARVEEDAIEVIASNQHLQQVLTGIVDRVLE